MLVRTSGSIYHTSTKKDYHDYKKYKRHEKSIESPIGPMLYYKQDRDMELGDEATKIFLNARGRADALKEGRELERAELVFSILKNGADREFIKKVTLLSDDELNQIITKA